MVWLLVALAVVVLIACEVALPGARRQNSDLGSVSANWVAQHRSDLG